MKTVDLTNAIPTLKELLALAESDDVIIRTSDGREFVLTEADEFAKEVEAVRNNPSLMAFLDERSKERGTFSLDEVRRALDAES